MKAVGSISCINLPGINKISSGTRQEKMKFPLFTRLHNKYNLRNLSLKLMVTDLKNDLMYDLTYLGKCC